MKTRWPTPNVDSASPSARHTELIVTPTCSAAARNWANAALKARKAPVEISPCSAYATTANTAIDVIIGQAALYTWSQLVTFSAP